MIFEFDYSSMMIDYISVSNVLVMDMRVKICWDKNTCVLDTTIMNKAEISTPVCNVNQGFIVKGR